MKLILIFFCFAVLLAEQRYLFWLVQLSWFIGGLWAAQPHGNKPIKKTSEPTKTNEAEDKRVEWTNQSTWICFLFCLMNEMNHEKGRKWIDCVCEWSPGPPAKGVRSQSTQPTNKPSANTKTKSCLLLDWWVWFVWLIVDCGAKCFHSISFLIFLHSHFKRIKMKFHSNVTNKKIL